MSALWLGVLAHLWQTTLVLLVLSALALLLRRAPARYQEWLWTAALVKLLVPLPLVALFWPAFTRLGYAVGQQETIGPAIKTLSQLANPRVLWLPPVDATGADSLQPMLAAATIGWGLGAAHSLATCLFFFYPPAWWLKRRLQRSAELACDEAVLAAGIDGLTYSKALAATVSLGLAPPVATALIGRSSVLRERLERIRAPERYRIMNRHRFAVLAGLAPGRPSLSSRQRHQRAGEDLPRQSRVSGARSSGSPGRLHHAGGRPQQGRHHQGCLGAARPRARPGGCRRRHAMALHADAVQR